MASFIVARPFIYVFGTIIDPNQNNPNETTIYGGHNGSMHNVTGHTHSGAVGDGGPLSPLSISFVPPVGSIIAFYDFGGGLTFNAANWAYCDGQTATFPGIGLQTLPDMSGRYLVGFGTDGGGAVPATSNGAATWATAPVGNPNNNVDLTHTHSVPGLSVPGLSIPGLSVPGLSFSGTTVGGSATGTTDTESAHTPGAGTLYALWCSGNDVTPSDDDSFYLVDQITPFTSSAQIGSSSDSIQRGAPFIRAADYGVQCAGTSGAGSAHSHPISSLTVAGQSFSGTTSGGTTTPSTTGTSTTGSDTSGSGLGVTSIQPISIRVRWIMRYL